MLTGTTFTEVKAAERIVEIQKDLVAQVLGAPRRANMAAEQLELWNEYFLGRPYEFIFGKAN